MSRGRAEPSGHGPVNARPRRSRVLHSLAVTSAREREGREGRRRRREKEENSR